VKENKITTERRLQIFSALIFKENITEQKRFGCARGWGVSGVNKYLRYSVARSDVVFLN
jgi:hypothetical protein